MIAPRQGLFASLLIVSFALHTFLVVLATTHQLDDNRTSQGQLMTSQLVADSLTELEPANTVSLALLANRYATNPSVASIRILDVKQQVLATSGMTKTRQGEVFSRDALLNEKKIGTVEITLIEPSIGEILRTQWLAILVSFLLHAALWLAYRVVARPSRSEFLARINNETRLKHEIQLLTQALELEKQNQHGRPQAQPVAKPVSATTANQDNVATKHILALNIQFYDPKQLLSSVNQSIANPYFNLCQLFLNKSLELAAKHYHLNAADFAMQHSFNAKGATLTIAEDQPQAVDCLLLTNAVFQLLSEVLYKRYREDKRFALQTRSAVAAAVDTMQLNALQAAEKLTSHLQAKESALYLNDEQLKAISNCYQLVAMPNPSNLLTRQAFMIQGMNADCADVAQQLRSEILMAKKAQTL